MQFLDPEIAEILQFLDPEIVTMDKIISGSRNCRNGAISVSRNRRKGRQILYQLTLQVILIGIPLEIAWTSTVSWMADVITCKIMVFLRLVDK